MSERWQRLQEIFHQALPLPSAERTALLERECGADPELRGEAERLLSAADRAAGFIQEPVLGQPGEDSSQVGRRIGSFRLTSLLGKGGMGAVYLAERDDGAFVQRVALKLIKRGMDTDQVLARFRAERQILASLDHPHIARLVDGGTTDDGLPYFAMEYIEGQPIDAFAESAGLGVDDRLRLFLMVCEAVSYAHGKGVVHRDIKPLNTLVTTAGVPKLLDFGIAKVLDDSSDAPTTATGLRLLTPDYASPEQIEGRHATVASDVYSLGVVLYELLTGRSPYRVTGGSPQEIAAAVVTTEPVRPSAAVTQPAGGARIRRAIATGAHLSRRLKGDLDTIVLTALRKEPARRYHSVAELAEDLRQHLEGRPIVARGDHALYRTGKFVRRNRTVLVATALVAFLTAIGFMLLRPGRDDPTLLSTQSLALRDRILVADFADRAGDTVLTAAITEAFRTDLAQSAVIRVMTPRQVRASLQRMKQSPDVALDDSLARELAVRERVKGIVTGSLARLSGAYTISVQLVAAQSGEALASVRETAADSSALVTAVDRASKLLRQRIGESLREMEEMPSLEEATTASLPALRLYTQAQRLGRQGKRTESIQRFEQAIALDTGFASAHLGLAMAYDAIAAEGKAGDAARRAVLHRERLPFVEGSFLIASRAYGAQDYPTAIRVYSEVVARYPDNMAALNNLALAYRDSRQYPEAEKWFWKAIAVDSMVANMYFGIHSSQVLRRDFAAARVTLDTIARRFPEHPVLLTEEMQDAAAQQDWDRAERVARLHIEKIGADTLQLVDPYEALAQIAMARGRLTAAEQLWRRHGVMARASEQMGRLFTGVLQRGWIEVRYRHDSARAVAIIDSALLATPLDSLLPGDRRLYEIARLYLAAGARSRVAPLLAAARVTDSLLERDLVGERSWTTGVLALSEGKPAEAIEKLRVASERLYCTNCVYPDLGRAYEAAGRLREAAEAYRFYLTTPWLWRYESDGAELGGVLQRLAEVSLKLGNRDEAVEAFRKLETLWRGADPALVRVVDALRQRLKEP